jgi:hypothetical protein
MVLAIPAVFGERAAEAGGAALALEDAQDL